MNEFKVGINFDQNLLNLFDDLNKQHDDCKITEVYGSDRKHAGLAARPDFRLPDIEYYEFVDYVKKANDMGIKFNYTMNSFIPYGSKDNLRYNFEKVVDFVHILESVGVHRITVANPILLELIRKKAKSNIEIEISTCAHIDTITQIKYYHEEYGVNKICGNLLKNRDFKFLENAARYCNDNGIVYELMANEFCGVGGDGYATHCIYRDSCYACHATNHTIQDANSLDGYPMNLCTQSRNKSKSNWLKMRFIRPEDLTTYNNIGLNHFKITGRTGSSEYIKKVIEGYMNKSFEGNLLELWKPLESIQPGKLEKDIDVMYIDNKSLDGFIDVWVNNRHNCDLEICGETCKYCDNFYNRIKE